MADLSLPQLPSIVWWKVRESFKKSIPKKVSSTYLSAILNLSEKSASKYLGSFVKLGLVDSDNSTTDLAAIWRDDETYSQACERILTDIYPEELLSVAPPPEPDLNQVANWIARHERLGAQAAQAKAVLYSLIASGNLPEAIETAPIRKVPATKRANQPKKKDSTSSEDASKPNHSTESKSDIDTRIQLNVQIHISADASNSQIEAIFSSMAKHLRNQ